MFSRQAQGSTVMERRSSVNVSIVARPSFDIRAFQSFLDHAGMDWKRTLGVGQNQEIIEAAGRVCYMSFGANQSAKTNDEYIHHLIRQGHESVLEHVNWSFVITGISRALSHQIVRHRVGFAFSQLSQQYHDEGDATYRMPPEVEANPAAAEAWTRAIDAAKKSYSDIISSLEQSNRNSTDLSERELSRAIRSAARSVLPSSTETTIFMTANARALRHFFAVRGSIIGDREMREISAALFKAVSSEAPAVFFDFKLRLLGDGSETVEMVSREADSDED